MVLPRMIAVLLLAAATAFAQDGSDIDYVKPSALKESFIGRKLHVDFFRRSFGGSDLDRITIKVDDESLVFVEHRVDDGFNCWFREQFLESEREFDKKRLRIVFFELIAIGNDRLKLRAHFAFFDRNGRKIAESDFTREVLFDTKDIFELLFKASA